MSEPSCIASCRRCEVDGDWSAAMNDNFLHDIRKDPPPEFLARLKSRLDLQPLTHAAPAGSTFRRVLLGLLLTGSVFAITLMVLNRNEPQPSPVVTTRSQPATHESAPTTANPPEVVANPATPPKAQASADTKPTIVATPIYSFVTT